MLPVIEQIDVAGKLCTSVRDVNVSNLDWGTGFFVVFLSPPDDYCDRIFIRLGLFPAKSFPIHHSPYNLTSTLQN